jgi:hypothetical protein
MKAATRRIGSVMRMTVAPALLVIGLALATLTSSAANASTGSAKTHMRYCMTVIAKVGRGEATSRVISHRCSSRHAPGSLRPAGTSHTASQTVLVIFFQNEGYTGQTDTVYGDSGPCDTAGYSLPNLTLAEYYTNGISSYQLYSNCKYASYWTETNFNGSKKTGVKGNQSYVGALFNDKIYSMRVWA